MKTIKMPKPTVALTPDEQAKHEWLCGWWGGIATGFILGVAACVLVAGHLGKL